MMCKKHYTISDENMKAWHFFNTILQDFVIDFERGKMYSVCVCATDGLEWSLPQGA